MLSDYVNKSVYWIATMVILPAMSMAATQPCATAKPTAESTKWNFAAEASGILQNLTSDAVDAANHAGELQAEQRDQMISWETHATQLESLKEDINKMGGMMCRLEEIRRVTPAWEQREIDRALPLLRTMAAQTQSAIQFVNKNPEHLWSPTYRSDVDTLSTAADRLSDSLRTFDQYASAHARELRLEHSLKTQRGA